MLNSKGDIPRVQWAGFCTDHLFLSISVNHAFKDSFNGKSIISKKRVIHYLGKIDILLFCWYKTFWFLTSDFLVSVSCTSFILPSVFLFCKYFITYLTWLFPQGHMRAGREALSPALEWRKTATLCQGQFLWWREQFLRPKCKMVQKHFVFSAMSIFVCKKVHVDDIFQEFI